MSVLTKVFSPLNSTIRLSRPHSSSQQLFTLGTNPCHFFLEFLKPTIRQIKITVTITITDMETITIIDLWIEKYVSYRLNKTKNKHKPPTFCSNIVTVYMYENLSQNSSIDCDKGKHLLRYFMKRIRLMAFVAVGKVHFTAARLSFKILKLLFNVRVQCKEEGERPFVKAILPRTSISRLWVNTNEK